MSLIDLLILLLIAGVCGSLGQAISGFSRGGCLVSIALGFIGALIGMWLARQFQLTEPLPINVGGKTFPVVWSIVGATIFVAIIGLISRRRV
ncbi:MAG TPA: GlsB/YeaQ/YmgE family stress response membrane protein [Pyrinomonadaceae bacterium]